MAWEKVRCGIGGEVYSQGSKIRDSGVEVS